MVVTERRIEVKGQPHTERLFLCSDLHIGASGTDHDKIRADFREAKERNARILVNGDVFDAILPSDHKRFSLSALHPEVLGKGIPRADVMNAVIELAEEMFAPVAHLVEVIGVGNHDTSVVKYHSLDPVSILIDRLNQKHGTQIKHGGYAGYYVLKARKQPRIYWNWKLRYHHGSGGSAPVSKGLIDQARMLAWLADVDVLWFGHKHNRIVDDGHLMERLTADGNVIYEPLTVVHTASYFEPSPGRPGWAQEKNFAPQRKGGFFLEVEFKASSHKQQIVNTRVLT